jgi:hypothetical protein
VKLTSAGNGGDALAVGDFNGDGKPDVVLGANSLGMMLGNGDGTFSSGASTSLPSPTAGPGAVVAADFNHDGHLDVAVAVYNAVVILMGKGDGTFQPYVSYPVPNGSSWLALGNFNGAHYANGDPILSLAVLGSAVTILTNKGDGTFVVGATTYAVGQNPAAMKAGNISGAHYPNGDPILDLVTINGGAGTVTILTGDGAGGFPTRADYPTGLFAPNRLDLGDVNGDGRLDIVIAGGSYGVMLNSGTGTSWTSKSIDAVYAPLEYDVHLADVNGDGKLDILTGGGLPIVALGNGDGTFQSPALLASGVRAVADLNGDGRLDLLNPGGSGVQVLLNHGCPTASLKAVSTQQYSNVGSDGQTWKDIDSTSTTPLQLTVTPTVDSQAIVSGNADLWTDTAGYNQDLGIAALGGIGTGTTYPRVAGQPEAWKESGGFAGTFSPNAGYVQTILHFKAGQAYTVKLQWKSNKPTVPTGTFVPAIYAGAGPIGTNYSATRLTVDLVPDANASVVSATGTSQFTLAGSDGNTWTDLGPGTDPALSFTAPANGLAILSGNADLWTDTATYNQDIGISVSGGSGSGTTYPTTLGQPEAWKESGGFAGTFSPNAAYVQSVLRLAAGQTYQAKLQWKANKADSGTIVGGAGPIGTAYSPTRLTLLFVPDSNSDQTNLVADQAITQQYPLSGSDGKTWSQIGYGFPTVNVTPPADCLAVISGNADLWTDTAGYNQDLGLSVTGGIYPSVPGQPEAWKESGGFAGTFSPNAAFVQTVIPVKGGTRYNVTLVWKTNKPTLVTPGSPPPAIYAGAGPVPSASNRYSPTRITVQFTGCP